MCSVFLPEEDRVVNIMCEHLDPVRPQLGDHFKVIHMSLLSFNLLSFSLTRCLIFIVLIVNGSHTMFWDCTVFCKDYISYVATRSKFYKVLLSE